MENLLVPPNASQRLPGHRVLVLAPHPDDEVFGCGGALLRHVADGVPVHVIIWTDGGFGVAAGTRAEYIAQRRRESCAAAAVIGYGTPEFRSYEDRALQYGEQLVNDILAAIDTFDADLVYAPSVLEMHPDHRALALAAIEAVRRRGGNTCVALYEIGIPHRPNLLLDITPFVARKQQAMECYTSQLERQRYDLDVAALNRYRSFSLPAAVSAAEAYIVATAGELALDPVGIHQSEYMRQRAMGLPLDGTGVPLVSVMIRSMDRASLALALDSVALQTYANIEVVVVNATGAAHRALGDSCGRFPLRLVEPGKALDRAAAANCGLDNARGELLIFLDDDDLYLPAHIARLQQELARNDHAIAAYAGVVCTDPSGKEVRRFAQEFDLTQLTVDNFIPMHALMFRRSALARGARFDESLPVCEDWDFWLQLQQHGTFRFVPETGAIYRMHAEAGSGVWSDTARNQRVILGIYRRRMPGWSDQLLWGIFEWARYKPLYEELNAQHLNLQQQLSDQVARDEQQRRNDRAAFQQQLATAEQLREQMVRERDATIAYYAGVQQQMIDAVERRDRHIALLQNSTSWRLTRPLRQIMGLLRRRPTEPTPAPAVSALQAAPPTRQEQPAPAVPVPAVQPETAERLIYDYEVNPDEQTAPNFVCELTGRDKRVLEVGCGPGSITKLLKTRNGCRVTGLELDAASIERARPWCEAIHQADLNTESWPGLLGTEKNFDVVIAADVLEHLYEPWRTLRQMAALIRPEGSVVVSLPHAGHAVIAGAFLSGDVAYADTGLLDRTHIRFFGMKNIEDLFAQAGLKIVEARYVVVPPEYTELAWNWNRLPEFIKAGIKYSKQSSVYQVVVRAVPVDQPGVACALPQAI